MSRVTKWRTYEPNLNEIKIALIKPNVAAKILISITLELESKRKF